MKKILFYIFFNILFLNLNFNIKKETVNGNSGKEDEVNYTQLKDVDDEEIIKRQQYLYSIKLGLNNYYDKNHSIGLDVFTKGVFKKNNNYRNFYPLYFNNDLKDTSLNDYGKTGYVNIYFKNLEINNNYKILPNHTKIEKEEYDLNTHRIFDTNVPMDLDYAFYQFSYNEVVNSHNNNIYNNGTDLNKSLKNYDKHSYVLNFNNINEGTYGLLAIGFGWFFFEPETFEINYNNQIHSIDYNSIVDYKYIYYYVGNDYVLFSLSPINSQISENISINDIKNDYKKNIFNLFIDSVNYNLMYSDNIYSDDKKYYLNAKYNANEVREEIIIENDRDLLTFTNTEHNNITYGC